MNTINEDENANAVLIELSEHREFLQEKEQRSIGARLSTSQSFGQCPRCQSISHISSGHPYCPDCNWDSLSDPINFQLAS